ncbi:hypothetical protein GQ607_016138 [Colletotrichum asianum]|uniref:Uncharacterized protein n=1 Tax=Colletotrichum asianum TaxID=702518 RepID=A0A8H3W1K2_9PEZI|nr:hypothetical protein GQ607_016138 [Colletotrichum asianum]
MKYHSVSNYSSRPLPYVLPGCRPGQQTFEKTAHNMDSPISPSEFIYNPRGRQRSVQSATLSIGSPVPAQLRPAESDIQRGLSYGPQPHRPDAQRWHVEFRHPSPDNSSCMRQIDRICFEATQRYVDGQVNRHTQNNYPASIELGISSGGSCEHHRQYAISNHGIFNGFFQIEGSLFSSNIRRICDGLWARSWQDRRDVHRDRQAVGDMANLLDWSYTISHVEDDDTKSRSEAERCKIAAARKLCAFMGDLESCDEIEELVSLEKEASPWLG